MITGAGDRLRALDDLAWDMIKFAYAPGSYSNMVTKRKRHMEFCYLFDLTPFPVTEWQCVRFTTYLSFWFKSPQSIKNYVSGICILNKLNGFGKVQRNILYRNAIRGIRRQLKHKTKQAEPMTRELLLKIVEIVDIDNDKELAIWVCMLFSFNLFLRKSNLVPESRIHDEQFQLSRKDLRYHNKVLLTHIKWSKTDQFCSKPLQLPMVLTKDSPICPVKWVLYMTKTIPALGTHNLFSFVDGGKVVPVTYGDLTLQMRIWLKKVGVNNYRSFSSHSLRRGGCTAAFEKGVPEISIRTLGNWASDAYKRYIKYHIGSKASGVDHVQQFLVWLQGQCGMFGRGRTAILPRVEHQKERLLAELQKGPPTTTRQKDCDTRNPA